MIDLKCGDCFKLLKEIADKSIDVSFTSPPYNRKRNDKYDNYDDTVENYFKFLCDFTEELLRVTKKYVFVNIQKNYYNKEDVFKYIGKYNTKIQEIIIWEKTNPMPASGNSVTNSYEFFIVLGDIPLKSNETYTKNIISSSVNSSTTLKEHRAVMKQEVSDYFIRNFTEIGDVVLDNFMGTGTTGVSCKKLKRDFIGIEIDKKYFEIAKKKIEESSSVYIVEAYNNINNLW
jgi:DNA modification methylase